MTVTLQERANLRVLLLNYAELLLVSDDNAHRYNISMHSILAG